MMCVMLFAQSKVEYIKLVLYVMWHMLLDCRVVHSFVRSFVLLFVLSFVLSLRSSHASVPSFGLEFIHLFFHCVQAMWWCGMNSLFYPTQRMTV